MRFFVDGRSQGTYGRERRKIVASQVIGKQFERDFQRLVSQWPVDQERGKVLIREFSELCGDVGQARFTAAVSAVIREGGIRFFPTISEFSSYVPPESNVARNCGKCRSGWVVAYYKKRKIPAMKRCECKGGAAADARLDEGEWKSDL